MTANYVKNKPASDEAGHATTKYLVYIKTNNRESHCLAEAGDDELHRLCKSIRQRPPSLTVVNPEEVWIPKRHR